MVEPTGYTALDLIGFTDKGPYDPTANYVRNDLVHVGNSTWRCKIDDTTGIAPTEGANWTIFIESATSLAGMSDVNLNTPKAGDGLVHNGNDWTNIPIMTKEQWKKNGAYNVGYHNFTTQTLNGITFTVNADKSITLNNTATATTTIHLFQATSASTVGLKEGTTYKLVGLTPTTPSCTLKVNSYYNSANHVAEDSGNGATFTFTGTSYGDFFYDYYLTIPSGTAFNNDTIYPMITTDLNATYDDYVPYAKTNRELTKNAIVIEKKLITSSIAVANGLFSFDISVAKTGYKAIGVAGFAFSRIADVVYTGVSIKDDNTVFVEGVNGTGTGANVQGNVTVMYQLS